MAITENINFPINGKNMLKVTFQTKVKLNEL